MTTYIHYGGNRFFPKQFRQIKNRPYFNKPYGGLWASPVDAEYGWKQWTEDNNFGVRNESDSFKFTILDGCEILHIRRKDDLDMLPVTTGKDVMDLTSIRCLDFERIRDSGFVAIELHLSQNWELYWDLYGWDCDCILVLNPDAIKEIKP